MRKKERKLVITFPEATEAMKMESFCKENNIAGRLLPVPAQITAGCGLAWKAEPEQRDYIIDTISKAGIKFGEDVILEV